MNEFERTAGPETTATEEAKGISLLRRAAIAREKRVHSLFLDVPSWEGDLIAEYQVVNRPRLETMARKITAEARGAGSESSARTSADIDFILEACVGLYAYDPEGSTEEERRVPIEDDLGKVNYNRFGDILVSIAAPERGIKERPKTARAVVLGCFAKEGDDASVPLSA